MPTHPIKAHVTAIMLLPSGEPIHSTVYYRAINTDLPAQELGEIVSHCVIKAWEDGYDPKGKTVTLSFN